MKTLKQFMSESSYGDPIENIADEFVEELDNLLEINSEDDYNEDSVNSVIEEAVINLLEYIDSRFDGNEQKAIRKAIQKFAKENK